MQSFDSAGVSTLAHTLPLGNTYLELLCNTMSQTFSYIDDGRNEGRIDQAQMIDRLSSCISPRRSLHLSCTRCRMLQEWVQSRSPRLVLQHESTSITVIHLRGQDQETTLHRSVCPAMSTPVILSRLLWCWHFVRIVCFTIEAGMLAKSSPA